jgi:hypothetical protein
LTLYTLPSSFVAVILSFTYRTQLIKRHHINQQNKTPFDITDEDFTARLNCNIIPGFHSQTTVILHQDFTARLNCNIINSVQHLTIYLIITTKCTICQRKFIFEILKLGVLSSILYAAQNTKIHHSLPV